ncbi:hypothetical protein AX15_006078 [Amanita polypyramis BW_CC]|nr:hypothetical protein AX15_006078 [Amanita polypyramis BW_CC]
MPEIPVYDPISSEEEDFEEGEDNEPEDDQEPLLVEDGIEEVQSVEFPAYFIERDGTLFHSVENAPYPLPFDGHEQRRQKMMHKLLYQLLHAHCAGPVSEALTWNAGEHGRNVLDLGTGTGKWVMDMGRTFPNSIFIGVDIVPIATRYPLENTQFEIQNISEGLRWSDGTFDLIHARDLSMGVRDWRVLVREVARLLRTGGLFVSCEWAPFLSVDPSFGVDIHTHAPASVRFFEAVNDALRFRHQLQPVGSNVYQYLAESQQFFEIRLEPHFVPIGGWPHDEALSQIGHYFRRICVRFTRSVRHLLKEYGLPDFEIAQIIADYIHELQNVEGLTCVYYITHARRV